ncbi:MAG: alpha/beta hydrolase [Beijerinckiaceae bacterium]|jgi:acetyl esterase/lipase|nr:alpha/beta hydrolase [Beijerinckiaceae bacterium]MDO9440038.1 alpha/beta hydrolase [Beijerinckiaceae bacterium]
MSQTNRTEVTTKSGVVYATHDGQELKATFYRPAGEGPFPVLVALHGGGWRQGSPTVYQHLGPWLAARGYALLAPLYRSAKAGQPSYPLAVHDVRAAVQFIKGEAAAFGVDPARVALMGESAGGHLAALTALAGREPLFADNAPQGRHSAIDASVKACIPIYGVFDLVQQWRHDLPVRLGDQGIVELFLGTTPARDRRICFDASPMSYAVEAKNKTAFMVVWGTQDDVVDPATQSIPFVEALKQAGFFVRTAIVEGAPHYWAGDPIEEDGSHSAFFAHRLLRFLQTKL